MTRSQQHAEIVTVEKGFVFCGLYLIRQGRGNHVKRYVHQLPDDAALFQPTQTKTAPAEKQDIQIHGISLYSSGLSG